MICSTYVNREVLNNLKETDIYKLSNFLELSIISNIYMFVIP